MGSSQPVQSHLQGNLRRPLTPQSPPFSSVFAKKNIKFLVIWEVTIAGSPHKGDAKFYNYDHISDTHVLNSLKSSSSQRQVFAQLNDPIIIQTHMSSIPWSPPQVGASPCSVLQLISRFPFLSKKSYPPPLIHMTSWCLQAVICTCLYLNQDKVLQRLHLSSCEPVGNCAVICFEKNAKFSWNASPKPYRMGGGTNIFYKIK